MTNEEKDDTAAYERWMAARHVRGSIVFRGTSEPVPCELVVNGFILDRIQGAPAPKEGK